MKRLLADILHWLGYGLCHQLPERSLFAGGLQSPVCARDVGIYLGFVVGFAVLQAVGRRRRPAELPSPWVWVVIGVLLGSMVFDGVTSYAGLRSTTNQLRLATGLAAGFAISALLVPLLNGQAWVRRGRDRVLGRPLDVVAWLIALPLTYVVVWYVGPLLGVVLPLATAVAILMTFTMVNSVIVMLIPPFECRAVTWIDLRTPLSIALVMSLVELAVSVWFKAALVDFASRLG